MAESVSSSDRSSIESQQHADRESQVDTGTHNDEVQGSPEALICLGVNRDFVIVEATGIQI